MSNLEPIEEKDLELKEKFIEKVEFKKETVPSSAESIPTPEMSAERKEGAMETDDVYSKILSKVKTTQPADDGAVQTDAAIANEAESAEKKVEKLIQLAMQKGVLHAVKVARHLEDNYALDEFHDRLLVDDLHSALVQKGLIEEV